MRYFVHLGEDRLEVDIEGDRVTVNGEPVEVALAPAGGSPIRNARVEGASLRVLPTPNGSGEWALEVEGVRHTLQVLDSGGEAIRTARSAALAHAGPSPLKAPMPGMVVRVEVAVGDEVAAGQGVVIVEAMKMENELKAPAPARVAAIHAVAGTAVEKDQLLVEFEPLGGEG